MQPNPCAQPWKWRESRAHRDTHGWRLSLPKVELRIFFGSTKNPLYKPLLTVIIVTLINCFAFVQDKRLSFCKKILYDIAYSIISIPLWAWNSTFLLEFLANLTLGIHNAQPRYKPGNWNRDILWFPIKCSHEARFYWICHYILFQGHVNLNCPICYWTCFLRYSV